jgi:hypothetical protein
MLAVMMMLILWGGIWAVGSVFGWFSEAAQVAKQEFGPKAMLTKYEWFKNASAALSAKQAGIGVLDERVKQIEADYQGVSRVKWDRTDKENVNLWRQEVAGLKLSYNNLAAEWNAQISKFNWRPFIGDLPPGAEQVLTKEFAPYKTE